jgi:hypothetical protein
MFSRIGQYILLNCGDLVQCVTDVARPDGARNLTRLRVYSPYYGHYERQTLEKVVKVSLIPNTCFIYSS